MFLLDTHPISKMLGGNGNGLSLATDHKSKNFARSQDTKESSTTCISVSYYEVEKHDLFIDVDV